MRHTSGDILGFKYLFALVATAFIVLALASGVAAGEVKVMVVVGLPDYGEDAKAVSVTDFNKYKADYEDFRKLLATSPSLADMAQEGWKIVHVGSTTEDHTIVIFERGK